MPVIAERSEQVFEMHLKVERTDKMVCEDRRKF